jgi:signal transduction histidine kinase
MEERDPNFLPKAIEGIEVQDNGVGIGREYQAVIFEKFRQVGDTLTEKPAGTGLGLAICRQIVGHFGGRLWVVSEPGRGPVFTFTLPATVPPSARLFVGA